MDTDNIEIEYLDHIALRVKDLEYSANWYEQVLGLEKVQPEEWKPWPIFMLKGNSGLALFPERAEERIAPDHFAFRVNRSSFEVAKKRLLDLGIKYSIQDHTYFESIYFSDPDDHIVELTVMIKPF